MSKTIVIDKPMQAFDDRTDFSRNNTDRQKWGEHKSSDNFQMSDEYKEPEAQAPPVATETPAPPAPQKFTHKLQNGTVLEADSVDALAALIEKSIQTPAPPAETDWEEKPAYEGTLFQRKELSLQDQANILNVWKENPQKAMRMLQEAEFGGTIENIIRSLNDAQMTIRQQKELEEQMDFLGECETYNPTKANGKKLTDYLKQNNKPCTKRNLMKAFQDLSKNDPSLIQTVTPPPAEEPEEPELQPPTVVPSNQGRQETIEQPKVDVEKFKRMSLEDQKKYFKSMSRVS